MVRRQTPEHRRAGDADDELTEELAAVRRPTRCDGTGLAPVTRAGDVPDGLRPRSTHGTSDVRHRCTPT